MAHTNKDDNTIIKEVISVIVKNEHNVLSRIAGLFSARGYNIDTLTVAPIEDCDSDLSRFTIAVEGNRRTINQIVKQLNKLIPVQKVIEHKDFVQKDTVLIKIPANENISDAKALIEAYNGLIQNVTDDSIIFSATDEPIRITNLLKIIKRYNPSEIYRSGVVAMER
jgi:acetolactate synthase-1/3 small subunit